MRQRIIQWGALAGMAGALLLTVGCETTGGSGSSSAGGAGNSANSEVSEGRGLYFGRCTACHAPEPVRDYTLAEWDALLPEMGDEANLNSGQRSAVRAYVRSFF